MKTIHRIASKLLAKAFLQDNLEANQRDQGWEDGRLYLMLEPNDPVVRAHGTDRLIIEDGMVLAAFNNDDGISTRSRMYNRGRTRAEITIVVTTDTTVRIVAKLMDTSRGESYTVNSEFAGEVTKVTDRSIEVSGVDGGNGALVKEHVVQPNSRFLFQPVVKVGQKVKKGAVLSEALTEGKAVIETTVAEISRCMDIQKLCLPLAGKAYRSLRGALYRGDSAEIDTVQRGLNNRLWQLGALSRCNDEGLRDALRELLAINDVFFENALEVADSAEAIELIRHHIAGNVELNEVLGAKVQEVRDRMAAERARKSRAITTVADVMEEKEREQKRRDELQAKRNKRKAAAAPLSAKQAADKLAAGLGIDPDDDELVERDEAQAGSAETESGETDGDETEGLPEVPPPATDEDASPRLTPKQQRMMDASKARPTTVVDPVPEAPKPTETVVKKIEVPKQDFRAVLAAKKASMSATAESAPAADAEPETK